LLYGVVVFLCLSLAAIGATFVIFEFKKRNAAYLSLREAYKDLETTKPLRKIGQSSAFINHEIKNYMMIISGYAALLAKSKELCDRDRGMVDNIAQTTAKLQEFSLSVLELSKSKSAQESDDVELMQTLRACIDARFSKQSSKFAVSYTPNGPDPMESVLVNGSQEKLERIFINAIRNSFEAGAQSIRVRFCACNTMVLIVIEDDGAGCDAAQLPNLSKTFFTTKCGSGGTGLGLCVIRSIIEAHGGNINIYSKNLLGGGKHGIMTQITLPASKRMPYEAAKHEFMLIKQDMDYAPVILEILKNLKIIPHIAQKTRDADLSPRNSSLGLIVMVAAENMAEISGRIGGGAESGIIVLPVEIGEGPAVFVGTGESKELFTEEFVAKYLSGSAG
jgi:nitrogen-specific signal transduction histidine kinase